MKVTSNGTETQPRSFPGLVGVIFLIGLLATGGAVVWSFVQEGSYRSASPPPVYGQLPDFTLTNQLGQTVTLASLHGHLWVADMIFTRCAGPCPRMTTNMSRLQTAVATMPKVRLVSITTDPNHDTPTVLQHYGDRYGNKPERWLFLTGDPQQIQQLATKGFKLGVAANSGADAQPGEDLFIHSTKFVLVDAAGQVRGYYDGTEPDGPAKLLQDLGALSRAR